MRAVIEGAVRKYTSRHIMYMYESNDRRGSRGGTRVVTSCICMRAVIEGAVRKYTSRHIMYVYESSDRRSSQEVHESSHYVCV